MRLGEIRKQARDVIEDAEEDARLYKFYRYCCFYSHGNLNTALTKDAGITVFSEFNINRVVEAISVNMLKIVSIVLEDSTLTVKVREAERMSSYLGDSSKEAGR